jgi:Alpha/beta hydrolase domain
MRSALADRSKHMAMVCAAAIFAVAAPAPTLAEVSRVVVKESGPMGTFGGRQYTWVTAAMEGTVARDDGTTGHYRVPVSLMYPDRDPNGFGFLDVVNSYDFHGYLDETAPMGKRKIYYNGDIIFSDYLRRDGFVYMSVQWARMVTEELGSDYGVIEDGRDGYEIVKDAARFLRAPDRLEGALASRPQAVDNVIAFGYSQSGSLLLEMVRSGRSRGQEGALIFDGVLAGGHDAWCVVLNNDATPRPGPGPTIPLFYRADYCDGPLPQHGKFIAIETETDLDTDQSYRMRHHSPTFRQYELAGVAHIPTDLNPLEQTGAKRQNPVSFRPVYKAMLRNLVDWIETGKEPPDSRYIEGRVVSEGEFEAATDADGNVKGGVRLPHMPTVLANGEQAGAPLGVYRGTDPDYKGHPNIYAWYGGSFEPFSAEELKARYPSHDAYVDLVEKAAAELLAERFILQEDYDAYVQSAKLQRW